jgi:hypothetical protein
MWSASRKRAAATGSADPQEGGAQKLLPQGLSATAAAYVASASGAAMTGAASAAGDKI